MQTSILLKPHYVIPRSWNKIIEVVPTGFNGPIMYYDGPSAIYESEETYACAPSTGRDDYGVWFKTRQAAERYYRRGCADILRRKISKMTREIEAIKAEIFQLGQG